MNINQILEIEGINERFEQVLKSLHKLGPSDSNILEKISYLKLFYPDLFKDSEDKVLSAIGVFHKIKNRSSIYSIFMMSFGMQYEKEFGIQLTPVQASIRRAISANQFTSISAPTSAGKSYSIREFIIQAKGDAVIVVPSRALIAEYVGSMKDAFKGNKGIMISPFVDKVFLNRSLRRIFILTPERTKDLFKLDAGYNIDLFFFDEAQISDDENRGVIFDVMIRRALKFYPHSKMIFAHPFVSNPDAHFKKHHIDFESSYSKSYTHGVVGKICIQKHSNGKYYYFSPYVNQGHKLLNCREFNGDFKEFAFGGKHTVLVYTSKSLIYSGEFIEEFKSYVDSYNHVNDENALRIIDEIKYLVGADDDDHKSNLVNLLQRGVVIHHGSIPLEVRFLLEEFIRAGFAKICFATSTLAQGINMPFDIVWLDNNRFSGNENERALSFKNIVGRSGRLSNEQVFDYGYVFTNNAKLFTDRVSARLVLRDTSVIDDPIHENDDNAELKLSIKDETFDEDKNLPKAKVDRISSDEVLSEAANCISILFANDSFASSLKGPENKENRRRLKSSLIVIYSAALGRELNKGETNVFNNAMSIFIRAVQGHSFREIAGFRYSVISNRDENHSGMAQFSQPAERLPNSSLGVYSLFKKMKANLVNYDAIVYDTYDYLDQVISFCLSDVFVACFKIYYEKTKDERATDIVDLFKYGTNNKKSIMLMRYGFPPDIIKEVLEYVKDINVNEITISKTVETASEKIRNLVEWYK